MVFVPPEPILVLISSTRRFNFTIYKMERDKTYSLCQIHTRLHLSQSSLASSIDHLPISLSFVGLIIGYEELQLVPWKKEVILTISEGCIETLRVSMWVDHENPVGLRYQTKKEVIGQFVHLHNVHIRSFDFTSSKELQFYGEIRPDDPRNHAITILIVSGASYVKYIRERQPFRLHQVMSVIPKSKNLAKELFPLQYSDIRLMDKICGVVSTYHHCIAKQITFVNEKNPFQKFINQQLQCEEDIRGYRKRASSLWVTSYNQQNDWYSRRACRNRPK